MQNFRSTPKRPEVLRTNGKLLIAAKIGITFAVSYSIYTEYNFIYSTIGQNITIPYIGGLIKFLISVSIISIIEGGGLVALAYIIDRILKKEVADNLINFLGAIVMMIICYSFAVTTSIGGTQKISSNWVEAPTIESTSNLDSTAQAAQAQINRQYSNDSLLISTNWNNQISAINNEYMAKVGRHQTTIDNYKRKAERTGKSYKSSINYVKGLQEKLKAAQAVEVGKLETSKGQELKPLLAERKTAAGAAAETYKSEKNKIVSSNDAAAGTYKAEKETVYTSMKYGIFFTLPLLAACMLLVRNIFHKAGIIEGTQFDDYFYRESIFSKAKNYYRVRFLETTHNFFDAKFKGLNKKEYELSENRIFERSDITKVVNLLDIQEQQMNFDDSDDNISATYKISDDTNRQKSYDDTTKENTTYDNRMNDKMVRKKVKYSDDIKSNLRKCIFCKTEYVYRHHKQKFCSDDCRKQNWEKVNGRKPMMKKAK